MRPVLNPSRPQNALAARLHRLLPSGGLRIVAVAVLASSALVPSLVQGQAEKESRYPYDPACSWGRLANGKGMIHRCLTEDEARRIAVSATPASSAPSPSASQVGSAPTTPSETPAPTAAPKDFTITVGPIRAAQGDITVGKLGKPLDRYRACIVDHGGLETQKGKIVVSFLVQAERSRAEGVEVVKATGVSKKAAACIADVIDRRQVGTPTEPTTGAELTIELTGQ